MTALVLVAFVLAATYANGANDVSKGVGTLVGSGLATYRRAIGWGTMWTVAGALGAIFVSARLAETFSTGLLVTTPLERDRFLVAVAAGVFIWVILASRTGMPVSTTHAMAGAILGAGLAAAGAGGIQWGLVGTSVALPLALSPVAAGLLAFGIPKATGGRLETASRYCVCIEQRRIGLVPIGPARRVSAVESSLPGIVVDRETACRRDSVVSGIRATDATHWMTSAALSFARGMNDNPKLIALGIGTAAAAGIASAWVFVAGAIAMGAGSCLYGRRVTHTLAEEVTGIDPLEGLSASSVAATLVLIASVAALPVSTTHVATGAIVGAGLSGGRTAIRWTTIRNVALAWLVTLPASGLVAAILWAGLGGLA